MPPQWTYEEEQLIMDRIEQQIRENDQNYHGKNSAFRDSFIFWLENVTRSLMMEIFQRVIPELLRNIVNKYKRW